MTAHLVFGFRRVAVPATIGKKLGILAAGVCCFILAACSTSQAALVSSEPFAAPAYTVGTELPTLNPAIAGYTGAWTDVDFGDAEPAVAAGSLDYTDPLYAPETGNKVGKAADTAGIGPTTSGRVFRLLDSSLLVNATTSGTRYLSVLFQTGNENAAPQPDIYSTIALGNGGTSDAQRELYFGIASEAFNLNSPDYAFMVDNNQTLRSAFGVARDANVHLFVFKFNLSATALSDSVTAWLDPTLGAGEPAGGVTFGGVDLTFDRLAISDYASNSSYWDEIRWGDSFDSVTVVPEPGAMLMLLSGLGILLFCRRTGG